MIFERDGCWPFQPAARAIRHKFYKFDSIFKDAGHAAVVLPQIHARLDPVSHLVGQSDGRVTAINEDRVELVELVPDGAGGWLERPATILLEDN